ncbi:hypothetical protein Rhe02_34090 [Rhizocola hellebori]|uniref:Tetratricopeptide repeat protein n=1 Tax=Rhizocola hellebori TaxID=1392758 RepID=A0A8J3Q8M4_9ACTN|nr:tetratricopeptide repeat protein [Rhizocola hellebori]GIH05342.1 hypothetical protein Rhe02_34090 [Rhizocola hellebori]
MLNDLGNAESYFDKAIERARAGDLDTAAELFRQASDRGHALAACTFAALLKDRGQLAEAEKHYRRALASGLPAGEQQLIADCECSLGYVRAQLGDDQDAERFYRAADARGYLDATFNLGNLLSRTGRVQEAESVWRRAASSGQADAAFNLAELVGERGDLAEAEGLLRQAIAAGLIDALTNLATVRLKRGDPSEAEALLREAVAAGDTNAVFNLGIVLNVRGKQEEAEAMMRRAMAEGHPEASAHVQRLVAAREAEAHLRKGVADGHPDAMLHAPQPPAQGSALGGYLPGDQIAHQTSAGTITGDHTQSLGDLGAFFAEESSKTDRMRAAKEFISALRARLQAAATAAQHSRDALAERSAQLLTDVATRLPIRRAETLHRKFGGDTETQSQQVIADASRLVSLLWTAAATVPGPPPVVQAVKVIVHSAIEIRMIGELYAIHSDASRDAAWLSTVLLAWATGEPVAPGGPPAAGTAVIVSKIRQSLVALTGSESRLATIASRGREGAGNVQRAGARMHRRMRLHPSSWAQQSGPSVGAMVRGAVVEAAAGKLAGRVPQALVSAAQDRLAPAVTPAASGEPAGQVATSSPQEALALAWALHQQAVAAASAISMPDSVATRLRVAIACQERHLQTLRQRLGQTAAVPAQRDGWGTADAARLVWQAEEAIDTVEDAGAQPRRLPEWSTRRRAAITYLVTALIVSAPSAFLLLSTSGIGRVGILLTQCLLLPWLSLAAGAIAIGPLFRPWLGGPVPRHPVVGTWIVVGVHLVLGVLAAVLGALG